MFARFFSEKKCTEYKHKTSLNILLIKKKYHIGLKGILKKKTYNTCPISFMTV